MTHTYPNLFNLSLHINLTIRHLKLLQLHLDFLLTFCGLTVINYNQLHCHLMGWTLSLDGYTIQYLSNLKSIIVL